MENTITTVNNSTMAWRFTNEFFGRNYTYVRRVSNRILKKTMIVKLLLKDDDNMETVKKEASILRRLKHPNIVKFWRRGETELYDFLFIEYAPKGTIEDKIEAGVGMLAVETWKYFNQLLSGVEYLHDNGVVHRNLETQHLVLDKYENLKICGFGTAAKFLRDNRRLVVRDGPIYNFNYQSPECIGYSDFLYIAEDIDIWSCGVILVVMLSGETPWERPNKFDVNYQLWRTADYASHSPWNKLNTMALSLLQKMLSHIPSDRYRNIDQIRSHPLFNQ